MSAALPVAVRPGAALPWRRAAAAIGGLLGAAHMGAPTPRVAALVQGEQETAEILIGLLQVVAIATFAVLYAISRAANPPPMEIEPVPIALALYAGFTGVRLWLALKRRLTPLVLTASVIVDMAVLMALIWSFHLQYMAPTAVVLKAPTLMYVYILIALRALRFEARYVLLAGAAAIAAYTVLVGCALLAQHPPAQVTRSFLTYVTSPAILIGAEFDKVVTMAMVTLLLALVVQRGRRLLEDAAREQLAAGELSRFFAPEVAERIRDSKDGVTAGMAERRRAAILITDLRGFTRMAQELPPAEMLSLLSEYQRCVVAAVRAHGGSVDKYLGDGVLASFGAVQPSASYAADALRAAEAVAVAMAEWNATRGGAPRLEMGAAIAAGEVLFGAVGVEQRLEYTVIGDPVNLAAKLEKHNKAEGTRMLAAADAFDLGVAQGYAPKVATRRLPGREVAGVPQLIDIVALG
ncbi:MAG TPA: adenylate/guanylate cyclase domain-containing protein [Crenalkalicoccus sp.]|nr:adenylate/guanylate cyclase domain-containing protein [Crenalkalicoccus sp.]